MSRKREENNITEIAKQSIPEPSEAFVADIRREFAANSAADMFAERNNRYLPRMLALAGSLCALLVLGICLKTAFGTNKAYADYYSMEPYNMNVNTTAEVTAEFIENELKSSDMSERFWAKLPYTGRYMPGEATGEYTVTGRYADDFPDYYGGSYINVDGKLIIVIKESYYNKDYRKSDWYKELSTMMGSEDFACRPVKYNYTEVINGFSDLVFGSLGEAIHEAGVSWVAAGFNDYYNRICIEVKSEEAAAVVKSIATSDLFTTMVVDYDPVDMIIDD